MRMFDSDKYIQIGVIQSRSIINPLGSIILDLNINEKKITDIQCDKVFSSAKGDKVFCWYSEFFDVELLICKPNVRIPKDMTLIDCVAGMWRVRAIKDISYCEFNTRWDKDFIWTDGGPNSGEHLDAQIWEDDKFSVAIGTEDGERLSNRALMNDYMPIRLESNLNNIGFVQYSNDSLIVPIPNLLAEEKCQVHFVVAWAKDYLPTWYAVDMHGKDILEGAECL